MTSKGNYFLTSPLENSPCREISCFHSWFRWYGIINIKVLCKIQFLFFPIIIIGKLYLLNSFTTWFNLNVYTVFAAFYTKLYVKLKKKVVRNRIIGFNRLSDKLFEFNFCSVLYSFFMDKNYIDFSEQGYSFFFAFLYTNTFTAIDKVYIDGFNPVSCLKGAR